MKIIKIVFVLFIAFGGFFISDASALEGTNQDAPAPIVAPDNAVPAELKFKENVDEAELTKFMEVWPRFMKWAYENDDPIVRVDNAFSEDAGADYSTGLVRWLSENGMQVDRFFYIENRAKKIIHSLETYDKALKAEKLILQMGNQTLTADRITELQEQYFSSIKIDEKLLFEKNKQMLLDMFASGYEQQQ